MVYESCYRKSILLMQCILDDEFIVFIIPTIFFSSYNLSEPNDKWLQKVLLDIIYEMILFNIDNSLRNETK